MATRTDSRNTYRYQFPAYFLDSYREHLLFLLGLSVFPPLASLLDLGSAGVSLENGVMGDFWENNSSSYLVSQYLGPGLLSLLLVDMFHEDTLVLESVTLGLQVQLVVQVAIDLLGILASLRKTHAILRVSSDGRKNL